MPQPRAGRDGRRPVGAWLKERGLSLNQEKTRIGRVDAGFDFLSFTIRRYHVRGGRQGAHQTQPHRAEEDPATATPRSCAACAAPTRPTVIGTLNPIIRGQANYYRPGASKKAFRALDDHLWRHLYKWARRRHPSKPRRWVTARYFGAFHPTRRDRWVFGDRDSGAYLHQYAWTTIVRHAPVPGRHSPDDPALAQYWADRRRKRKPPQLAPSWERALRTQHGRCPLCGEPLLHRGRPARLLHPVGDLVPGNPHGAGPPGHHREQQRADDLPPRTHPLRATSPRRRPAPARPAPARMPDRPRGLLEPCAATSGTHGS